MWIASTATEERKQQVLFKINNNRTIQTAKTYPSLQYLNVPSATRSCRNLIEIDVTIKTTRQMWPKDHIEMNETGKLTHKCWRNGSEEQLLAPHWHPVLGILHLSHQALHLSSTTTTSENGMFFFFLFERKNATVSPLQLIPAGWWMEWKENGVSRSSMWNSHKQQLNRRDHWGDCQESVGWLRTGNLANVISSKIRSKHQTNPIRK